MRIRRPEDDNLELQMASLMDCIFILLIFFVVTTTMKKSQRQMPIELPDSSAAATVAEKADEVVIGLDAKGPFGAESEVDVIPEHGRVAALFRQ